jgi:hypothetical protein
MRGERREIWFSTECFIEPQSALKSLATFNSPEKRVQTTLRSLRITLRPPREPVLHFPYMPTSRRMAVHMRGIATIRNCSASRNVGVELLFDIDLNIT